MDDYDIILTDCGNIVQTFSSDDQINKIEFLDNDGFLHLPKNTSYFHENKNYLEVETNSKEIFKNANILIIGCNIIRRLPSLLRMKNLGFKKFVGLMDEKVWAYEFFDDVILAEHKNVDFKEDTLQKVKDYMKIHSIKFDGILTFTCSCTQMTAFLQEKLNLPGISYELVKNIKNKHQFRTICFDLGIKTPDFFLICSSDRQAYLNEHFKNENDSNIIKDFANIKSISLPVIVKNPIGVGKGLKLFYRIEIFNFKLYYDVIIY